MYEWKNLIRKSTRISGRGILMCSLLIATLLTFYSLGNLSSGESQLPGCVTIRVQYQDGCPRPGALVRVLGPFEAPFGTTNESGMVSVWGWLEPNQDYYVAAYWPNLGTMFSEWLFVTNEYGNADVTMIHYSDHPNKFIMNLTSPTNDVRFVENALSDSSTTKDLTFSGNESKTVYLRLPKHSTVLSAKLNLSADYVVEYTEWDDTEDYVSFQGGDGSGAVDENWTTSWAIDTTDPCYVYEAYKLPELRSIERIKWRAKAGGYLSCHVYVCLWNYSRNDWSDILLHFNEPHHYWWSDATIDVDSHDFVQSGFHFNISTKLLGNGPYYGGYAEYFEGEVSWGYPVYSSDPFLNVGDDEDIKWSYFGEFNESVSPQSTSDLSAEINEYLANATPDETGLIDVPIVLHSNTPGKIRISDISVTYDYDTSYLYNIQASPHVFTVDHTADVSSREVCMCGYYIDDNSTSAKVDGKEYTMKTINGHNYVEFIELALEGSHWKNHTVWWNTLSLHDVAVLGVSPSRTEVIIGQTENITVNVKNEGIYTETFNVTVYYDENPVQAREVTDLAPNAQADLTFNWNTIGIPADITYMIKAEASIVENELDLVDNTLVNGTVVIRTLKASEITPCDNSGSPEGSFETGSMANFKLRIDNTALELANVLMTINIYDSNNTAIGVASFQGPITSGVSTFIIGVPIPSSAHLGNATVYANAFTDWPRNGGTPYCSEVSATFQIIGP